MSLDKSIVEKAIEKSQRYIKEIEAYHPEHRDLVKITQQLLQERETLKEKMGFIKDHFDAAIRQADQPKGGQHVSPSGGHFWPVGPGIIQKFRRWSRDMTEWLK